MKINKIWESALRVSTRWNSWLVTNAVLECLFLGFWGIAVLGATGSYGIAIGMLLPCYWLREKAKHIRRLERCIEINRNFWESAESDSVSGNTLVKTMRELCRSTKLNA